MKSSVSDEDMTIGEMADRFGVAFHVLRYWESAGLLAPARHESGHRRYGSADLRRVAMILIGKEAGLGLRELRELLSSADPMDHSDLLRGHVTVLECRIAQAQAAKEVIQHALDCPLSFDECPHARERIASRIPSSRHQRWRVSGVPGTDSP
jgi:DNA-binding transcriptional MerR regulator